jgi:antitoxin MazE
LLHSIQEKPVMEATLKKWGNSAAVRIPAAVLSAARVKVDDAVDVRAEDGRIVIEPRRRRLFALDELVRAITADNQHAPVDTGSPVGREIW